MKKIFKIVCLGFFGIIVVLGIIDNIIGFHNSSNTTASEPATAVTGQAETTNTEAKTKTDEKATTAQKKAEEEAAAKQKADQQALAQAQQKEKLDAEIQNAKNGSYQEKMKVMKDYINIDKADLLAKNPSVQDMGFAGDLFIQTNKNTVKQLNSVGNQLISQQANGVYWEVEVTLNNSGSNPIQANTDMFTLVTSDGRKFSTETKAEMMISKSVIMETLNPGVDVKGYLIFDVPADLNISDVMLNVQNGFSNVKLKLS